MNNNTNAITASAISAHEAWMTEQIAMITPFMATQINEDHVKEALAGEYLAREMVAQDVAFLARLEALTDAELRAEHAENKVEHYRPYAEGMDDYSEYDVNDYESYYHVQGTIESLLEYREVMARYTRPTPLTHNPFAVLAA